MSIVEWIDPPTSSFGGGVSHEHLSIAKELRDNPNVWGLIRRGSSNSTLVSGINKGDSVAYRPAGHFEATSRKSPGESDKFDIYARFVGDDTPPV